MAPTSGRAKEIIVKNRVLKINFKKLKTVIITALSSLNSSHKDLDTLDAFADYYFATFDRYYKENGKEYTLVLFKMIHDQATNLALRDSIKPIPFHKCGNDGVSRLLNLVKPLLLSSDDKVIRLILTITRVYEAIRLDPTLDETSIVEPYSGSISMDEFTVELKSYLSRSKWFKGWQVMFQRQLKPIKQLRGRIRSGPNGQSIITAHYDAIAISQTPHLHEALIEWNNIHNQPFVNKQLNWSIDQSKDLTLGKVRTGKIALIAERAGKTRPTAVGDYWSQNSLQPLHDALMELLRSIHTDSTYDQDKGFFRIQQSGHRNKWISGMDLSKATDRMPIEVIQAVLELLYQNPRTAQLWKTIMVDRDFWFDNKEYRWQVGNPLGLLSSWAAFTVAHHCIIQYSFHKAMARQDFFWGYAVLGDDVAIWHRSTAKYYTKLMNGIGVTINKTKSVTSATGQYRFEFAKRISLNGKELTGFSFALVHNSTKSIYYYVDLILHQVKTKFLSRPLSLVYPSYLTSKGVKYLEILLWEQELSVPPQLQGNTESTELLSKLRRACLHERLNRMKRISEDLGAALGSKSLQDYYDQGGIKYSNNLFGYNDLPLCHPIVVALNHTGMQMYDAIEWLQHLANDEDLILQQEVYPGLKDFEYLPLPHMSAYFERPGKRDPFNRRTHSEIVLKSIHNLRDDLPVVLPQNKAPSRDKI